MSAHMGRVRFDAKSGLPIVRLAKSQSGGRSLGFVMEGESIAALSPLEEANLRRRFGFETAPAPTGRVGPSAATPFITASRIAPMSLQLDVAKAQTAAMIGTSSPAFNPVQAGIFGTIGRILGGAATGFLGGGPIGAVRGAFRGIAGPAPVPTVPTFAAPGLPTPQDVGGALRRGFRFPGAEIDTPFFDARLTGGEVGAFGPATAAPTMIAAGPTIGCPSGFHPNKTGYFLRNGTFIAPGTKCVRNRKRNPMNPRALSRAIARVESGKRVAKRLSRITIRKEKCP